MITKAIILERIINSNTYAVRVPFLESAGIRTGKIIATLSDNPAISEEYRVGDVVYVGFEEHQAEKVVILGKLSLNENEPRGHANLESLDVQNSARLPKNTTIGDVDYSEILSAFRKFDSKQDTLIPGNNITIENNVISASGGGGGEPDNYLVSASVSGNNLTLTPNTGNPIVYSPSTITSVNWGDIEGTLSDQTDLQEALDEKLEVYEVTQSDIENVVSGNIIFTKDFSDKVRSMKYLLKVNKQLFNPQAENKDFYLKPEANEILNDYSVYTYAATSGVFETYVDSVVFGYDPNLDRCVSNTGLVSHITIPQTIAEDNNSIQLDSGDGGRIGSPVYFATINNQPIVGGGNIDTPNDNDYHEPRFSSGLSIASSSNVSEIHVPYATSSTYGVIQDLYSNYVPYSNASQAVDLNGKKLTTGMLHATSFVDFDKDINLGQYSSSAHILFYTGDGSNQHYTTLGPNSATSSNASIILPSQSGVLALQSELPTVYNAGLTIQLNSSTIGTFTANASNSSVINIDLSEYATSSFIAENYVPYSGASKTIDLNSQSFIARGIWFYEASSVSSGSTVYTANIHFASSDDTLHIGTLGELSVYAQDGIVLSTGIIGTHLKQSSTDIVLLPTSKAYYGSNSDASNEIARIGDIQGFVPYANAVSDVDLGSNSLRGQNLTVHGGELIIEDASQNYVAHYNGSFIDIINNGPNYYLNYPVLNDGDDFTIATEEYVGSYVQANINPSSTPVLLSTIKVGSLIYAIPSQSGQGQFIPLSGTANLSGNIVPLVSSGYSYTLGGSNREFAALHVRTIYGAAYEGLAVVATGGDLSVFGVSAINMSASNVNVYASSSVSIRGEYGVDISAQLDINLRAENNGDITLYADNDVKVTGGNFTFNSIPVATISYVQANPSGMSISGTLASIKIGSSTYVIPSVGSVSWGDIGGDLNSQTDLMSKFDDYANLSASVNNFTGDVEVDGDLTLVGYLKQPISGGYINVFELPSESGKLALVSEIPDLNGYATEVYVDNHHTMVNATSLSDADIDRILVKGGIVILDDEQLSLTLAPPNQQLSLTMTNSINTNNDSSLSPTMLNTIDGNNNAGLTQTIINTELSI